MDAETTIGKIPDQLKKEEFRFVPIKEGMKNPYEKNWQNGNNYKYNHSKIRKMVNNGGNYGVVCGCGNLTVIDADKQKIVDAVEQNLPPTFTVKTGGGGYHFYYKCPDLENPIRLTEEKAGDLGDVQCEGKQVVGPGSTHPNGNHYKVEAGHNIAKIKAEDIKFALRDWLKDIKDSKMSKNAESFDIDIEQVLDVSNLKHHGNEYYGKHPKHGSTTGKNFWINTKENVWHCFRHDTGGGPLQWVAVKEGIINCSEATPGALKDNRKFRLVLEELEERGLYSPSRTDHKAKLPYFTEKGKFIPKALAEELIEDKNYATHLKSETIHVYEDGIYREYGEQDVKKEAQERLGSLSKRSYIRETVEYLRNSTYRRPEEFGGPKNLIPCENGIIDLEKNKLKDFDPSYIFLSKIPVKYDPEAECPKVKQFITEIVNDEDVKIIQEMFGYCLWKDYPLAKAFMLIGGGANGKSTLLKLLSKFLGEENTCSPSLQELLNNRFKKIELFGKLANIHADLGVEALEDTGTFKMLTGGDKVLGEKKGKDPIEFYNHAKLIFSANEYPRTEDRTDAFFRRWIVINFPNQFLEGNPETDPNILEKITTEEELSGILNWAMKGLKRILEKGHFSKTKAREEVEGEWIRRTDSLRAFLDECIQFEQGSKIAKEFFFKLYKSYCNEHNIYTMKKGTVTKAVPSKEPRTEIYQPLICDKQVRCWRDIDVKPEVVEKDFFRKTLVKMTNDENTQDNQGKLYSSLMRENDKIPNIVWSFDKVDYPVYTQPSGSEDEDQKRLEDSNNTSSQKELVDDIVQTLQMGEFSQEELVEFLVSEKDFEKDRVEELVKRMLQKGDLVENIGGVLSAV